MSEKRDAVLAHPRIMPVGRAEVAQLAHVRGIPVEEAARALNTLRTQMIRAEQHDPLRCGYEPGIWKVADALVGKEVCRDVEFLDHIRDRFGMDWPTWARAMRRKLGFARPVTMLLVMGGNRSGKSEYAAKRGVEKLSFEERKRVLACHFSGPRSEAEQQPLYYKYLPAEWRAEGDITTKTAYIHFTQKNGFAGGSFITPMEGRGLFVNYTVEASRALEGKEEDYINADELVPLDWLQAMPMRIASRDGICVVTFTPVDGWTPSVHEFAGGAQVARESVSYLLPKDGGQRDLARALNLTEAEYPEVITAKGERRTNLAPWSRPEDVCAWLEEGDGAVAPVVERVLFRQ